MQQTILPMDEASSFAKASSSAKATADTTADTPLKNHSIDEVVNAIISALGQQIFSDTFSNIAEDLGFMDKERAITITHCVNNFYTKQYPTQQCTKEIFDALYAKNSSFRAAIIFLQKKYARNNLLLLTGKTLATIEDPSADQPCTKLNTFPLPIKKYLMERTLDDYQDTTEIALISDNEGNPITAFDICAVTHQAATCDSNHSFCLWDLKTAQPIDSHNTKHSIKQICFNNDGSLIATRTNKQVEIWQPTTKTLTLCYALELNQERLPLYHLSYAQETSENLLSIFHKNTKTEGASVWLISPNTNKFVCFQKDIAPIDTQPLSIEKGNYSACDPKSQFNQSTLHVTKKNFHPLLLCKIAAQQTKKSTAVSPILLSQSYAQLTPHDCDVFYEKLKQNPCFQNNTQPITPIEKPTNT